MDNNSNEFIQLVDRAKNGDQQAFTDLYNSSYKLVYLTCLSHLKNQQDAEDVAQDVFMKVYNKLNTLSDNRTFYGWVKTIAVNKSLNKIEARRDNLSYDDAIESGENLEGSDNLEMLPDSVIFEEEKRKIMMDIIKNELPETQYQTVVMYYYDELTVAQIATMLNCPVPTVKKRLQAARIKIRSGIEEYEHRTGDKLCAAAAIPSLGMLFKSTFGVPSVGLVGSAVPAGVAASAQQPQTRAPHDTSDNQPVKGNAGSDAGKASKAGKVAASAAKKGVGIKIAAVAAAVAVVGTGSVVAINALKDDIKPYDPEQTYEVGDSFTMGNFDGENLTWKVIDEKDDHYFVILDSNLEARAFDEDSASWDDSDLRTWLNEDFIYDAFEKGEYKYILHASDKIFELSAEEVEDLLDDDTIAIGSEYWLRTPSEDGTQVAAVDADGEIIYVDFDDELAVRPAMWVGEETEEPVATTAEETVIETEPVEEIVDNSIYDAFLNGEATVDMSNITNSPDYIPDDINISSSGYTVNEMLNWFDTELFSGLSAQSWYNPQAYYYFIDCGEDGYPELAIKYEGIGIYNSAPGNTESYIVVIKYIDGEYKLIYAFSDSGRARSSISYNGYVNLGDMECSSVDVIGANGQYQTVEHMYQDVVHRAPYGYEDNADVIAVTNYMQETNNNSWVTFVTLGDGRECICIYDEETRTNVANNTGVRIYSSDELDQVVSDYVQSCGYPAESELNSMSFDWIPLGSGVASEPVGTEVAETEPVNDPNKALYEAFFRDEVVVHTNEIYNDSEMDVYFSELVEDVYTVHSYDHTAPAAVSYAYIDCGLDGRSELVLKFDNMDLNWDGNINDYLMIAFHILNGEIYEMGDLYNSDAEAYREDISSTGMLYDSYMDKVYGYYGADSFHSIDEGGAPTDEGVWSEQFDWTPIV